MTLTTFRKSILKNRHLFLYGILLAILIFILKWLQWQFLIVENSLEIYIGLIAVFFTLSGSWIATRLVKSKIQKEIIEKEIYVPASQDSIINQAALKALHLTNREYEVLTLLSKGESNAATTAILLQQFFMFHIYSLSKKTYFFQT